jgi:hypothetical protein
MDRIIEAQFAVETHEEYGTLGLRPVDMPNADPLGGMAVPHDMLEHFPGDDGGVEAEFMALGAMLLIRGQTGFLQRSGNVNPPESHIAADFILLYRHVADEGFSLLDPGEEDTGPLGDEHGDADSVLRRAVRLGLESTKEEERYNANRDEDEFGTDADDDELVIFCSDQTGERILGWLRKGYRKAVERYAGVDIYTLAYTVFEEIEGRVNKWLNSSAEEGMFLDVTVNLDRLSVSLEAGYGNGTETDYCSKCEGSGELDGEEQGNYHDCSEGCTSEESNETCHECEGNGYVTPPVKCDTCEGSGEVSADYREPI